MHLQILYSGKDRSAGFKNRAWTPNLICINTHKIVKKNAFVFIGTGSP